MASMRPRAEDGNMATDESVAVLIKLPSVVRVSPSPVLRTGDAERSEYREIVSTSKGLRQRLSVGNFFDRVQQNSVEAGSSRRASIEKERELKAFKFCTVEHAHSPTQYGCVQRMLGKATSQTEAQHIQSMCDEDSCLMPEPLQIARRETGTMPKKLRRKAREVLPSRARERKDENAADRKIVCLLELNRAGYKDLATRLQSDAMAFQNNPVHRAMERARSSSLSKDRQTIGPWNADDFANTDKEAGKASHSPASANTYDSDTASTIRASTRSVYSIGASPVPSVIDGDGVPTCEDQSMMQMPYTTLDGVHRPSSDMSKISNMTARESVHRKSLPPKEREKKNAFLNLVRLFEGPQGAPSRRFSLLGLRNRAKGRHGSSGSLPRQRASDHNQQPNGMVNLQGPPVLPNGTQDDDGFSAEVWSKRLATTMEAYTSADQEKMVVAPSFSTAPEVVRSRPWHPAYDSYISRRLMDENPWAAHNASLVHGPWEMSAQKASASSIDSMSPVSRSLPRDPATPTVICELADTSRTASRSPYEGSHFQTSHGQHELEDRTSKYDPNGRTGRFNSGTADAYELDVGVAKQRNGTR